jgi:hypothetical protein
VVSVRMPLFVLSIKKIKKKPGLSGQVVKNKG